MAISFLKKYYRHIIKAVIILAILVGVVWFNQYAVSRDHIVSWMIQFGYGGIFVASIASGFNLIIPIPIIGFFPLFVEAGFHAQYLIAIISFGMLIGDVLGYLIGDLGKDIFDRRAQKPRFIRVLYRLRDTHRLIPFVVLFLYAAFVPLPNELIVIPLAFMGYRLGPMIGALLIGNIMFNTLVAYGFLGIHNIL